MRFFFSEDHVVTFLFASFFSVACISPSQGGRHLHLRLQGPGRDRRRARPCRLQGQQEGLPHRQRGEQMRYALRAWTIRVAQVMDGGSTREFSSRPPCQVPPPPGLHASFVSTYSSICSDTRDSKTRARHPSLVSFPWHSRLSLPPYFTCSCGICCVLFLPLSCSVRHGKLGRFDRPELRRAGFSLRKVRRPRPRDSGLSLQPVRFAGTPLSFYFHWLSTLIFV